VRPLGYFFSKVDLLFCSVLNELFIDLNYPKDNRPAVSRARVPASVQGRSGGQASAGRAVGAAKLCRACIKGNSGMVFN